MTDTTNPWILTEIMDCLDPGHSLSPAETGRLVALVERQRERTISEQIGQWADNEIEDPVLVAKTCAIILVALLCVDNNATSAGMNLKDVAVRGVKTGNWSLRLRHHL